MGKRLIISAVFGIFAAAVAAAAVYTVITCRNTTPVLLFAPEEATERVEEMMEAVCSGDFSAAASTMYGNPDLNANQKSEDSVNQMFWEAFVDSLDYELVGQLYATDSGMAQDVKIISMELSSSTEKLGQRARELLQQGVDQASDTFEIYDIHNAYKASFVESVLIQAAQQALEEDMRYMYQVVAVQLVYSNDQWWVVPGRELLNAISGGTAG